MSDKDIILTFKVTADVKKAFEKVVNEKGQTRSAVLREALHEYLRREAIKTQELYAKPIVIKTEGELLEKISELYDYKNDIKLIKEACEKLCGQKKQENTS